MHEPSHDPRDDSGDTSARYAVVIGDTPAARALVRQQARLGPVRHAGFEPVSGRDLGPVLELPLAADPAAIHLAAGSAGAGLVAIDLPDDVATLAALAALVDGAGKADGGRAIVANLRDPALRRVTDANLFAAGIAPRPRIVSTAALAAGAAIVEAEPHALAYWRGQARVHAVVIGFSTLGRAVFEDLILSGIAGELGMPRVTILDPDPLAVRKRLDRDMPEIALSAEIAVIELDALTLTAPGGPLAEAERAAPLTLIVIALDDLGPALGIMTSLARMQESENLAVGSVLVLTEAQRSLFDLARPAGRERDLGRRWTVRGGIEGDADVLDLVTHRADRLAALIHETYRARFGGFGLAGAPWAALPETYRRANRRAAEHLPLKLWTLGLREAAGSAGPFAVEPHTYDNVIRPCAASTAEDALLRRLSRIEHDRWCAERRLDGWRYGEVRDDARRIHPKLVPFDDPRFTDEDIEKDADQVRFLFGTVVEAAAGGAVTPLVLGVLAGPRASPGIDIPAALLLCRKEAWRPVVVVSGLVDAAECRLLAALDRELGAAGRGWRLVVPEVSRDNREIRAIPEPADQALLRTFLDRPSTRFAPIGGVMTAADLWADPSAPDPHAEAIAAYVAARASAIVDGTQETAAPP